MKRNLLKRVLSLGLVSSMLFSTSVFAANLGSATIDASSTVQTGFINMIVPTTLTVAINPFEYKDTSQITTPDLFVVNKSDVNVKFSVAFKATPASGVTLATSKTAVNQTDSTVIAKQVYLAAVPATTATTLLASDTANLTLNPATTIAYSSTNVATIRNATATPATKLEFLLGKATYTTADGADAVVGDFSAAAGESGVALFRLIGAVNPYATYAASDVAVNMTYTTTGVAGTTYDNAVLTDKNVYSCDVLPYTEDKTVAADVGADVELTYSPGKGNLATTNALGTTYIGIKKSGATTETNLMTGAKASYDTTTKKIIIKASTIAELGEGTYTITAWYGAVAASGTLTITTP